MKNREALFPNRIKFTDEETGKQYVGTWDYADSPTEVGTKLTADVFLSDDNAAEYGIESEDPTPNEVFTALSKHASRHASEGSDPIAPADIGAAREIGGEIVTTSTDKTLALTDAGKLILCNNSSAITITIPDNASVAFPIGTEIRILRYYGGSVTISASSEVYLYSIGSSSSDIGTSKKIINRYEVVRLKKLYENRWVLEDNTTESVSPIKSTADAASYSFTVSDVGQTVCPSYLAANIDVVYTMPKNVSAKITTGSVIPVLFRYGKSLKITFEGDARSAILGDTTWVANRTYEIPERFGMVALQKVDTGSTTEYWVVQGNVEVVE